MRETYGDRQCELSVNKGGITGELPRPFFSIKKGRGFLFTSIIEIRRRMR